MFDSVITAIEKDGIKYIITQKDGKKITIHTWVSEVFSLSESTSTEQPTKEFIEECKKGLIDFILLEDGRHYFMNKEAIKHIEGKYIYFKSGEPLKIEYSTLEDMKKLQ